MLGVLVVDEVVGVPVGVLLGYLVGIVELRPRVLSGLDVIQWLGDVLVIQVQVLVSLVTGILPHLVVALVLDCEVLVVLLVQPLHDLSSDLLAIMEVVIVVLGW